jgi:hypothetical protein
MISSQRRTEWGFIMVDIFNGWSFEFFIIIFNTFVIPILALLLGILSVFKWKSKIIRWICPVINIPICFYLFLITLPEGSPFQPNQTNAEVIMGLLLFFGWSLLCSGLAEFAVRFCGKRNRSSGE